MHLQYNTDHCSLFPRNGVYTLSNETFSTVAKLYTLYYETEYPLFVPKARKAILERYSKMFKICKNNFFSMNRTLLDAGVSEELETGTVVQFG
jgi:hypothetical protein